MVIMRNRSLTMLLMGFILLFVVPQVQSGGSDKCAESTSFMCPYLSETCGETVYVSDCQDCDGYLSTDPQEKVCFDRKLLNGKDNPNPSYLWRDILGLIIWFCAAGVATACGVGGGGIYVPLGILLLNFAPKASSGLSQASIFGASLGGLLLNLRNMHPFTTKTSSDHLESESVPTKDDQENDQDTIYYTRPLIDFDMALFLAPMEMAGAVMGVLVQKLMPNWLYLTLAAIILCFTAYKTFSKFKDTHQKETEARRTAEQQSGDQVSNAKPVEANPQDMGIEEAVEEALAKPSLDQPIEKADSKQDTIEDHADGALSVHETEYSQMSNGDKVARQKYWLEKDSRQFPSEKVFGLCVLWVGLVVLTFMKGGKGVDSIVGITCASPWYAVLIVIQFVWTMGFSAIFGYRLMKQTEDKAACDYHMHSQDVIWDFQKVRFYAFFTFMAGIVAGMIGIGGGMVLGPLMLVMGIHPRVSSATTATMVVLTSSSVAVLFVTYGLVPWEYAVTFFSVCFVGAYIGKTKIDGYVKKTGRASILILLLAVIIALATIGCIVIVLTRLAEADWCFAGFNKFCSVSDDDSEGDMCPVDRLLSAKPW